MFRYRVLFLIGCSVLATLVVLGRLAHLQLVKGELYRAQIIERKKSALELAKGFRASFTDRDGHVLVRDLPSYDLALRVDHLLIQDKDHELSRAFKEMEGVWKAHQAFLNSRTPPTREQKDSRSKEFSDKMKKIEVGLGRLPWIRLLARTVGQDHEQVSRDLFRALDTVARGWAYKRTPVTFLKNVDQKVWSYLRSQQEDALRNRALMSRVLRRQMEESEGGPTGYSDLSFPGLICSFSARRTYLYGSFASHLVGMVGTMSTEQIKELLCRGELFENRSSRESIWKEIQANMTPQQIGDLEQLLNTNMRSLVSLDALLAGLANLDAPSQKLAAGLGLKDPLRWINQPERPALMRLCETEKLWLREHLNDKGEVRADATLKDQTIGETGVERWYNERNRGKHGLKIRRSGGDENYEDSFFSKRARPVQGETLALTLDWNWQRACEDELRSIAASGPLARGAVVVLNSDNGEILAMASYPDFDPNLFAPPRMNNEQIGKLLQDPAKPLLNRCISDRFPLGSVIKPFIAAVALQEGVITGDQKFPCEGALQVGPHTSFRCDSGCHHGLVDTREAIRRSCNVFFYRLGMKLGLERMAPWARKLGFGQRLGVDVFGEVSGLYPDPESARGWTKGSDCQIAIGQGPVSVTPLQATAMIAAIANGGYAVHPHAWLQAKGVERTALGFSGSVLAVVREGMKEVVHVGMPGQRGTGHAAFFGHGEPLAISVAGKTGTADVGDRETTTQPHAWFGGYAPADHPQVAFCVFVQNGGHGGDVAAPIAYRILKRIYGLRHGPEASNEAHP